MTSHKSLKFIWLMGLTAVSINTVSAATMSEDARLKKEHEQPPSSQAAVIGLGSGIVLGAVVAGPAGAAIAGFLGALVGENTAQNDAINELSTQLSHSQTDNAWLTAKNRSLQQQMQLTQVNYEEELMQIPSPTLQSSIQFKTGSVVVEPLYTEQLALIASALKGNDKLTVRLTGQADKRGDAQFNQALSMQRALSVKKSLTELGVSSEQIMLVAVGEAQSQQSDHEGIFFDRKVEIEIAERSPVLMSSTMQ